jgi:hypothetical protein
MKMNRRRLSDEKCKVEAKGRIRIRAEKTNANHELLTHQGDRRSCGRIAMSLRATFWFGSVAFCRTCDASPIEGVDAKALHPKPGCQCV